MREINRNNYEEYMLDYLEGELSAAENCIVEAFLEEHPDIKEEIEGLGSLNLDPDTSEYPDKLSLKKNLITIVGEINEDNYEDFFVAHYEKQLSKREERILKHFLKENKCLQEEFKLFQNTYYKAETIHYPRKKELKKTKTVYLSIVTSVSAAAACLLLFFNILSDSSTLSIEQNIPLAHADERIAPTAIPRKTASIELATADKHIIQHQETKTPSPSVKQTKVRFSENDSKMSSLPFVKVKTIAAHRDFINQDMYFRYDASRALNEYIAQQEQKKKSRFLNKLLASINNKYQESTAAEIVQVADNKINKLIENYSSPIEEEEDLKLSN